ncbi:hypothetical protein E8E15_007153 [Penicillium rubens]|uniref:Pc21g06950 protein n=2 Tax=Penicillium chrysogenum species complex TaxID=254878 RepID=B6HJR2_PENRW|nr:uncharacterized protein N7525_007166 [Penicillium rubens]KZN88446.1 Uncharacterized protein EN45_070180 [Penicillium chrysogenum]CAP95592.1 Pc21g06950 [Penicillium rubens Wisconsin 54-1255]KAF3028068.1 hypothetical protein E8E15_007153 [Penicillium rubens]KAJ5049442.1 hypothetical protein NUH16_007961 [Penicillium rubens]KAJ5828913.1 hypothetical protein N7525_007166 [Penicillium rubens]
MDIPISQIKPAYPPNPPNPTQEEPAIQSTINALHLCAHPEGGYFCETDRDPRRVPNPYKEPATSATAEDTDPETRSACTSIYYLLTPQRPQGAFHRNKSRTVHVWQRGRGRYVIIHADEVDGSVENAKARVETFIVGPNVEAGERMQWVVEGGKYKSSFLLPDEPEGETSSGLLISEVVVPGFEFADHDFLRKERMEELLTAEQVQELGWMLRTEK